MISRPKFLKKYLCIRHFDGQSDSELSLKIGQVVEVLEKDRSGWWLVYSYDRKGYVPRSHLIAMDSDENYYKHNSDAASELYLAVKGYNARRSDELSLSAGSHVEIVAKSEDGWWTVRTIGDNVVCGRYPAIYLKSLLNNEKVNKCSKDLPRSNSKRTAFFNFPVIKRRNSHSVETPRISYQEQSDQSCNYSQYFALDDYDDIYGDSLSFQRGDSMTVLHKTNTGWWLVSFNGKQGWVPSSYLTQQKPSPKTPTSIFKFEKASIRNKQLLKTDKIKEVSKKEIYSWKDSEYVKAKESARRAEESMVNAALNDFTASVMHELKAKLSACHKEPDTQSQKSADNKLYAIVGLRQQKKRVN